GEGFAAASFTAPTMTFSASGDVGGERISFSETLHGYASTAPKWAAWPDISDDPARPFSRFEPLLRAGMQWSSTSDVIERTEIEVVQPGIEQQLVMGRFEVFGMSGGTITRMVVGDTEGTMVMEMPAMQPAPDGTTPPPSRQTMTVKQGPQELVGYSVAP